MFIFYPILMVYKYNNLRIKEFADSKRIGGRTIANKLGMSNDKAPRGWLNGSEQIRMVHFLNFVNTFGLDIKEFFYQDDVLMSDIADSENIKCSSATDTQSAPNVEHELEKLRTTVFQLEKEHLQVIAQKELELSRKELEMYKDIRKELKEEFKDEKQQIIDSYEARLSERENTIGKLQQQLAILTAELKEAGTYQKSKGYQPLGEVKMVSETNIEPY